MAHEAYKILFNLDRFESFASLSLFPVSVLDSYYVSLLGNFNSAIQNFRICIWSYKILFFLSQLQYSDLFNCKPDFYLDDFQKI
jgi:hypothetical protein